MKPHGWKLCILMIWLTLAGAVAHAETYRYEDADGVMVFTDDPAKLPRKAGKVKTYADDAVSATPGKKTAPSPAPSSPTPPRARKAAPDVRRRDGFYEIGGRTFNDIRREIYYRSPRRIGDGVAVAWCAWSVSWQIQTRHDGTLCHVEAAETRVDLGITMPRWVNYRTAGDGMKAAWDTYYQSVLKHEATHGEYGIAAGRDIQRRLPELPGRYSCRDLQEDAAHLAQTIIRDYQARNEEFDRNSLNADMITDVQMAADQREGVLGRQYPERRGAPTEK